MADEILLVLETEDKTVRVVQRGRERLLLFGFSEQSTMNMDDPDRGGFEYMDFFLLPCLLEIPVRKVLFLGLGAGVGPRMYLARWPQAEITAVEVDPGVVDIARDYFALPQTPLLRVTLGDGRAFLEHTAETYDVIILDAFEHRYGVSQIPEHLATEEFYELVRGHLSETGLALQNLIGHTYSESVREAAQILGRVFRGAYLFFVKSSLNAVVAGSMQPALTKGELRERARRARCHPAPRHLNLTELANLVVSAEG
jgi:spermidine synthase